MLTIAAGMNAGAASSGQEVHQLADARLTRLRRAIPGVGHKTDAELRAMGVATAQDLRAVSRAALVVRFGERVASLLFLACRGKVG